MDSRAQSLSPAIVIDFDMINDNMVVVKIRDIGEKRYQSTRAATGVIVLTLCGGAMNVTIKQKQPITNEKEMKMK